MLRSLRLGGLDEELAEAVGLYDALDVPFTAVAGSESDGESGVTKSDVIDVEMESPMGAPATPPLAFTSSLVSPIGPPPMACMDRPGILEPQLPEVDTSMALVATASQSESAVELEKLGAYIDEGGRAAARLAGGH